MLCNFAALAKINNKQQWQPWRIKRETTPKSKLKPGPGPVPFACQPDRPSACHVLSANAASNQLLSCLSDCPPGWLPAPTWRCTLWFDLGQTPSAL